MATRRMPKIKKKKIPLPRKIKTGVAAAPIHNFRHFAEYFRMDLDQKEISFICGIGSTLHQRTAH